MTLTAQSSIAAIRRAIEKADQEKQAIDPRWSAEARREREAELAAALKGQVEKHRDEGLAALEAARAELLARHHRAMLAAGPSTPDQWQEAAAREGFLAQDLDAMPATEIPAFYAAARDAKDQVGAWLILRLGTRRLNDILDNDPPHDSAQVTAIGKALQELLALSPATPAAAEQKAELKALGEEQAELWRAFSAGVPGDDRPVTRF